MRSVLGIDAGWTLNQPSGVALVAEKQGKWRLLRVAHSYAAFLSDEDRTTVGLFDAATLIRQSATIAGEAPTLVAADIPLARGAIVGRRTSDNMVSVAYGARHASTHTPSAPRPGPISEHIRNGFAGAGYPLRTSSPVDHGLIEVYPHPALIELAAAERRLPYKEGKIRKYWPELAMPERRLKLLDQWDLIIDLLDKAIDGVRKAFPPIALPAPRRQLKAFEDALDAVVCAWVGIMVLKGKAQPHGDDDSAIWIPNPRTKA